MALFSEMMDEASGKDAEIRRLRVALSECAAEFKSEPCTVMQGAAILAHEFQRRMQVAADALNRNR